MRRSPAYIASLDGLRAGAVAIVFLGHGLPPPFPGELGVTVFFFLSGYLITTLLRAEFEAKGSISLRAFYARRVLRIFPPFYLALTGATILAALGALGPARLTAATVISQATYLTNYFLVAGEWFPGIPWGGAAGTGVYWSLAVEEHFYLFFPLLYLALLRHLPSRRRQAAVLVAVCALVLAWRCFLVFGLHSGKDRTYVATDARIDSILFGCILAVAGNPVLDDSRISGRTLKAVLLPLGLLGLLAGFAVRSQAFHESFRYTLQGICLVPIFVVAIRHPEWGPMRALNWRWVRFLGVLSYSMYLVHLTVLSGLEARLRAPLAVRTSAGAVITVALAYAVHRLVEKPLARWRRRLSRLDRAPAPEAPALRGPIQPAAAQLGDRLAGGMSSMRRTMVSIVKGTLHRHGYDLVRLTGPSAPPVDLEFPVDFDEETIATVRSVQGFTMTSPEKIFALCHAVRYVARHGVPGAVVECGVWKGGSMMAAARTLREVGDNRRELYLFDTFAGMPEPGADDVDFAGVSALDEWRRFHHSRLNAPARAAVDEVREALRTVGYPEGHVHLVRGMVEDTVPCQAPSCIALLRLDTDYYGSTRHELEHLYPRLAPGGVLIIDDYGHFQGARRAVDEYLREHRLPVLLHRIDYSGRVLLKPPA